MQHLAEITGTIEKIAKRYARRVRWADVHDLMQEGWLAVLDAERKGHLPAEATHARNYARKIVVRRLQRYLWDQSAPVTSSKPERTNAGLHRASLDAWQGATNDSPEWAYLRAEALAALPGLRERLRERLLAIWDHYATERTHELYAALSVLLDGVSYHVVVQQTRANRSGVELNARWLREHASNDELSRAILWRIAQRRSDMCVT